jgi:hypothetical protein
MLPLYIDTNHNDFGGDVYVMANAPSLFLRNSSGVCVRWEGGPEVNTLQ